MSTATHVISSAGEELVRVMAPEDLQNARLGIGTEWLLTNGIGGYCSSTLSGQLARRYHGLLVAALPAPLGRVVMVTTVSERVRLPDGTVEWLTNRDLAGHPGQHGHLLEAFSLELGLPCWRFQLPSGSLNKQVFMVYGQNSVLLRYAYHGEGQLRLSLRPFLNPRQHEAPLSNQLVEPAESALHRDGVELRFASPLPSMQWRFEGRRAAFTAEAAQVRDVVYQTERERGYEFEGALWSPGYVRCDLADGEHVSMLVTTEGWDVASALSAHEIVDTEMGRRRQLLATAGRTGHDRVGAELVLAADQFIVTPSWRTRDIARARAGGVEPRSIVAGYHWFTDWGRDTMISLEGLTQPTGRAPEARAILLSFAQHMRDGLIPNLFPEGDHAGLYHTADATLWMFHAVHRYVKNAGDTSLLERLLPVLQESLDRHMAGTHFNIRMDPADALLSQGEEGFQLTWMDAKVGDWVVTPRRGKAVEINALWYNALRLTADWSAQFATGEGSQKYAETAERVSRSFNERFWFDEGQYLYDVIDGESGRHDPALRPNQVFAISLDHPVLDRARWPAVMDAVQAHLLTPVGLRSLDPHHPDFKAQYYGDLRSRDAAYHQGTVWSWLIGPYADAWLKLHPGKQDEARQFLSGLVRHLGEAGVGSISEIFDATPPFTPRGCIAQAWGVAEMLRLWSALDAQETREDA